MRFTLEIELGNDAMQTFDNVVGAMMAQPYRDKLQHGDSGKLRDANGNTVGKWEVTA